MDSAVAASKIRIYPFTQLMDALPMAGRSILLPTFIVGEEQGLSTTRVLRPHLYTLQAAFQCTGMPPVVLFVADVGQNWESLHAAAHGSERRHNPLSASPTGKSAQAVNSTSICLLSSRFRQATRQWNHPSPAT